MNWSASVLDPAVLWLLGAIASKAILSVLIAVTAPVLRPVWALFMRARRPWPAAVLVVFGIACSVAGGLLLQKPNSSSLEGGLGVVLFMGGAFVALAGPAFWFDERNRVASLARGRRRARWLTNVAAAK